MIKYFYLKIFINIRKGFLQYKMISLSKCEPFSCWSFIIYTKITKSLIEIEWNISVIICKYFGIDYAKSCLLIRNNCYWRLLHCTPSFSEWRKSFPGGWWWKRYCYHLYVKHIKFCMISIWSRWQLYDDPSRIIQEIEVSF